MWDCWYWCYNVCVLVYGIGVVNTTALLLGMPKDVTLTINIVRPQLWCCYLARLRIRDSLTRRLIVPPSPDPRPPIVRRRLSRGRWVGIVFARCMSIHSSTVGGRRRC